MASRSSRNAHQLAPRWILYGIEREIPISCTAMIPSLQTEWEADQRPIRLAKLRSFWERSLPPAIETQYWDMKQPLYPEPSAVFTGFWEAFVHDIVGPCRVHYRERTAIVTLWSPFWPDRTEWEFHLAPRPRTARP